MKAIDIENTVAPLLQEALKLEKEAKELRALAKEVETRLNKFAIPSQPVLSNDPPAEITRDALLAAIRRKGGRVNHYAERLGTTEEKIREIIESSTDITIGDKGWVKLQ